MRIEPSITTRDGSVTFLFANGYKVKFSNGKTNKCSGCKELINGIKSLSAEVVIRDTDGNIVTTRAFKELWLSGAEDSEGWVPPHAIAELLVWADKQSPGTISEEI